MHPKAYLVLGLALVQIPQAIAVPRNYKKNAHVHLPHAHHRLSPYDKCTLVLCGTVLLTCALALIAQSCRISALIVRRTQQWKQEEYHADGTHAMADRGNTKRGIISRYATRYGGIVEQVTEVDGIRKVVLVVNARLPTSEDQDAYDDWFRRWCQRQETVSRDVGEGAADEMTPLMGVQQPETPRYCEEGEVSQRELRSRDGSAGWAIDSRIHGWLCREPTTVKRLLTWLMRVPGLSSGNQSLSSSPPNHAATASI